MPSDSFKQYGKLFTIKEIHSFDNRSIKAVDKAFPRCSVTARNLPLSSDALAKRMGAASGGGTHVFAFTADFSNAPSERLMAVTERI